MKPKDRIDLISHIGRELQDTMTTIDINIYLQSFGIRTPDVSMARSKWVYVREILAVVKEDVILRIARDLAIPIPIGPMAPAAGDLREFLHNRAIDTCIDDFERALAAIDADPATAVGMASTTLETICKAILDSMEFDYPKDESLQGLYKAAQARLKLSPDQHADPELKRILGGLVNTAAGIATLRTKFSTFHGRGRRQYRLGKRHARLAINAMSAAGLFLLETYEERYAKTGSA